MPPIDPPRFDHPSACATVNKKRTKSENVCVHFNDETYGETYGMFVADPNTYGADKEWCLLKPIPIALDDSEPPPDDDEAQVGAGPPTGGAGASSSAATARV